MGKYINAYADMTAYNADTTKDFPNISLIKSTGAIVHNMEDPTTYPLTFMAEDDNFTFQCTSALTYSINGGEWTSLAANTSSPAMSSGDTVQFKATNTPNSSNGCGGFKTNGRFKAYGSPASMIYGDDYENNLSSVPAYGFAYMFTYREGWDEYPCTGLTDASGIKLPATTLGDQCYRQMFYGCTSLTNAPALPATTLVSSCYKDMFLLCSSLTTAPELPATTLANNCYDGMFRGCTSLTTAPELPATTLADSCYVYMFSGCTSLATAPELPATTLAGGCYSSMFMNCTSLATAPALPATTLASWCYGFMFNGCTSLNYITCLATDISASGSVNNWVNNVASSGTFVKASNMTGWGTGNNGIPTNWTVQDYGQN